MKSRLFILLVAVAIAAAGYVYWVTSRPVPVLDPVAPPTDVAPTLDAPAEGAGDAGDPTADPVATPD